MRRRLSLLVCAASLQLACSRPSAAPAVAAPAPAPAERSSVGIIVTTEEAVPVLDLMRRAEQRLQAGELASARQDFELLLAARHDRTTEARIRLGYAQTLEGLGDLDAAARELALRIDLVPETERDSARLELMRRLLLLERFSDAEAAQREIGRSTLRPEDLVLVGAVDALALRERGELTRAEGALSPAWALLDADGAEVARSFRSSAAWVSFAAGEIAGARASRILFDPVPDDVAATLEARCRPALAAQSAYAEAMRLDAGWLRLVAGERIARLYLDLHRDILAAPLPANLTSPEGRALAEGALLLRYEVLLDKAEQMLRITLSGTPDTLATGPARQRVLTALDGVVQTRARHAAQVEGLPVERGELGRILESLGAPPSLPEAAPTGR